VALRILAIFPIFICFFFQNFHLISTFLEINGKLVQVRNFEFLSRPLNPGIFFWTQADTDLPNDTIFIKLSKNNHDPIRRCIGMHQQTELDDHSKIYEVLAYTIPAVQWVPVGNGKAFPLNAISAGFYRGHGVDHKQYIARCRHESSVLIGYAYNYKDKAVFHTGFWNQEIQYYEFEVLVENYAVFPHEVLAKRK
jgi:Protein of unknown function (DUF3421)